MRNSQGPLNLMYFSTSLKVIAKDFYKYSHIFGPLPGKFAVAK